MTKRWQRLSERDTTFTLSLAVRQKELQHFRKISERTFQEEIQYDSGGGREGARARACERTRNRELVCVWWVCVWCVCEWDFENDKQKRRERKRETEKERERVCVREKERKCVCVWEGERQKEKDSKRETPATLIDERLVKQRRSRLFGREILSKKNNSHVWAGCFQKDSSNPFLRNHAKSGDDMNRALFSIYRALFSIYRALVGFYHAHGETPGRFTGTCTFKRWHTQGSIQNIQDLGGSFECI